MKIFVTNTTNQSNCDTCIIAAYKVKNIHTSINTDDKKAGNYESGDADNYSDLVRLEWSGFDPQIHSIRQKASGALGLQCSSRLNIYYK